MQVQEKETRASLALFSHRRELTQKANGVLTRPAREPPTLNQEHATLKIPPRKLPDVPMVELANN
eukprot:5681774-Pyramimonas_sp.AAC.1